MGEITRRAARLEAAAAGQVRYDPGRPCKYGHISLRYTSTDGCIDCLRIKVPKRNGATDAVRKGLAFFPKTAALFIDHGEPVDPEEAQAVFRYMFDLQNNGGWHMMALKHLQESPPLLEKYIRRPLTDAAIKEGMAAARALPDYVLAEILAGRTKK